MQVGAGSAVWQWIWTEIQCAGANLGPGIHGHELDQGLAFIGSKCCDEALAFGPHIGQFAERLLDAPFPSSKLRQGQRLLSLAERCTRERWY